MIIDLSLRPALKAIIYISINLSDIIPLIPKSPAKGGTAPGLSSNAFKSS
jgi:hypothetical protein